MFDDDDDDIDGLFATKSTARPAALTAKPKPKPNAKPDALWDSDSGAVTAHTDGVGGRGWLVVRAVGGLGGDLLPC